MLSANLGFPSDNVRSATAIGLHPGSALLLAIKVDAADDSTSLLARGTVGQNRAAYDKLMAGYIERHRARLRWKATGEALRSPRLFELSAAADSIAHACIISQVLDPSVFTPLSGSECGDSNADATAMSPHVIYLLTHPVAPARYVCVVDGGLQLADGGGGYHTHGENSHTQARNLGHTLRSLMGLVNLPGEGDPNKLDSDKTMIVLTTEFGRTPHGQSPRGRNHWPYGYPIVFGGPIRGAGKGVFGATGPDFKAIPGVPPSPRGEPHRRAHGARYLALRPGELQRLHVPGAGSEEGAATLVSSASWGSPHEPRCLGGAPRGRDHRGRPRRVRRRSSAVLRRLDHHVEQLRIEQRRRRRRSARAAARLDRVSGQRSSVGAPRGARPRRAPHLGSGRGQRRSRTPSRRFAPPIRRPPRRPMVGGDLETPKRLVARALMRESAFRERRATSSRGAGHINRIEGKSQESCYGLPNPNAIDDGSIAAYVRDNDSSSSAPPLHDFTMGQLLSPRRSSSTISAWCTGPTSSP